MSFLGGVTEEVRVALSSQTPRNLPRRITKGFGFLYQRSLYLVIPKKTSEEDYFADKGWTFGVDFLQRPGANFDRNKPYFTRRFRKWWQNISEVQRQKRLAGGFWWKPAHARCSLVDKSKRSLDVFCGVMTWGSWMELHGLRHRTIEYEIDVQV